ncbi:MAG: hypothetical protein GY938_13010 [Ketobacter sp.]|nr:hypothetical protein [Ketobacter sp.]
MIDTLSLPASEAWTNQISKILNNGYVVIPSIYNHEHETSMPCVTKEVVGTQMVVDMNYPVIVVPERNLSYKFMAAESLWILDGSNDLEAIARYNKVMRRFSDDGKTLFGAYGPKFISQLPYILETLSEDTGSRRAVFNIWRESPPPTKDTPCTLNAQFLIRGNKLNMIVNMRSSDVWLGVPYDIFAFSMMSFKVLSELNDAHGEAWLGIGDLYINFGSSHIYLGEEDGQQNNGLGAIKCISSDKRYELGPKVPYGYLVTKNGYELFIKQIRRMCNLNFSGEYMFAITE